MRYNTLGRSDIKVSPLCLGSMTWGTQNIETEAHEQIDMALAYGINFIDTAEMYPTNPLSLETQGDTERIIGSWIEKTGRRDEVVLATKVSGAGYKNVRDGAAISPKTIIDALEDSLKSLKTDYIDLYQLHWPNRGSYMFRQNWHFDPTDQDGGEVERHMLEVLETFETLIREGKIRAIGLSNESCWGTTQWLECAEKNTLPRMMSVQNEYSLLHRLYDLDMAEMTHHENVGLLAYSPLACGLLTGKYAPDTKPPEGTRLAITGNLGGRTTDRAWKAIDAYRQVAENFGLDLSQMSLAWCLRRPFMTSVILGATSTAQLETILKSAEVTLKDEVMKAISETHYAHPMPF